MKKICTLLLLFVAISLSAQWTNVGSPDFSGEYAGSTSIAFDGSGTAYVAFGDGSQSGKATVMKYSGGAWVVVGSAGFSPGAVSGLTIAFSHNIPIVAFSDGANSYKTTVMKLNNSNTWVTIGAAGFSAGAAYSPTLAIDNTGIPYVAFTDAANSNKATVMTLSGTTWVNLGTAGFTTGAASHPAMAINGTTPYVVFADATPAITVMSYNGSSWVAEGNTSFGGNAQTVAIAVDNTGALYVAAPLASNSGDVYAYKLVSNTWTQLGTGAVSAGAAQSPQLAIDANNIVYVAYQDVANSNKATLMQYSGSSWSAVGSAGFSPGKVYNVSVAVGPGDAPYVAFSDYTDSNKVTLMTYGGTASVNNINESDISVYPNPVSADVYINCPLAVSNLSVYDINGRLVLEEKQPVTNHFNIGNFTSGLYLVKITTAEQVYIKKIVKE